MAAKRYELSDGQWDRIASLLPGKAGDPGRTGTDNRVFINGCLWVLRSGAHWRDLPERYGKWKTVHKRFSRWCHAGVWDRVFETLKADRNNQYLMIGGYNATTGATNPSADLASATNRVIGRIDMSGNADTTTALNDAFNLSNIRSVTSTNGSDIWAAGNGGTGQGPSAGPA